jgi:hypothetical protein
METDEQVSAETTAVETPETTVETDNGSEADTNTSEEADKGDLRVPLKEERTKRQELEAQLNDPDFIYQQAQRLGLTEAQAQAVADESQNNFQTAQTPDVQSLVRQTLEVEKAKEKYPELAKDVDLGVMVTALMQKGYSPLKAADKVFERFGKAKEEGKVEGVVQAKTEITDKERAQTVSSGANVSSDQAELERLVKDSKSLNPATQKNAMLELIKRQNKESGII